MKKLSINIFFCIFTIILSFTLIEICCRIYSGFFNKNIPLTRWEFRLTQPKAYRNSYFFNKEFIFESMQSVSLNKAANPDALVLNDFNGKYLNVVDGFRYTTHQPKCYNRRILMFGGSTLFSQEVPDWETIPSHIQRLVNNSVSLKNYIVHNYGMVSLTVGQQKDLLKKISIKKDDIVIFYGGVNDIYYLVYNGYKDGWKPGKPSFRPIVRLTWYQKLMHFLYLRFSNYSAAIKIFMDVYDRNIPFTIADTKIFQNNLNQAVDSYFDAIVSSYEYVTAHGGYFFHFLQPNIFTLSKNSDYEKELIKNYLQTPPGIEKAFKSSYPEMIKATNKLRNVGIKSYNISDVLDERSNDEEYYLDFCHINHTANKIIANKIFEIISSKN